MYKDTQSVAVIITAAGSSSRMNGTDKIMAPLQGKPVLAWSCEVCNRCITVDGIVLVVSETNIDAANEMVRYYRWNKVRAVCAGGARRQDSVGNGLARAAGFDWVLVHDGARPLLTERLIDDGLSAAEATGAAIAAVPVKDTIKTAGDDMTVLDTPPRERLWAVQTPQVFRYEVLQSGYRIDAPDVTDDAMLAELAGYRVVLYNGDYSNIKITTPEDMVTAEALVNYYGK